MVDQRTANQGDDPADLSARTRALAEYRSRGPIGYRLVMLGKAIVALASVPLVWLLLATLTGFYPGTGTPWAGSEAPATAQVGDCRRVGPVSVNGFGNWWECQVEVALEDGRTFHTVVFNSMVTPADAGRPVEFRAACDGDSLDCAVGRPAPLIFAVLLALLHLAQIAFIIVLIGTTAFYLLDAVVGPHRYFAIVDWATKKKMTP
ncbi:DUF6346 domain-containing protein [Actinoplanes sp. NPDC023936]|uniref:DUF6346 domain-containing protein n=1 Tax=Actinoplanes sp. NPDC023936 TaxID=3154910 RepID=UPI00340D7EE4